MNNAFHSGNHQKGLELLGQYTQENTSDAEQLYRYAVIAEQVGTKAQADNAYEQCLQYVKNNCLVYLYAGCYFLATGQKDKGLSILSQGQDIDSRMTDFYLMNQGDEQTQRRSYQADMALRQHFTDLHQSSCQNSELVKTAIWPQNHTKNVDYKEENQRPHLFYIPEITARPFWQLEQLPYFQAFEQCYADIKQEFLSLQRELNQLSEPYLHEQYKQGDFETLAGSDNWTALHLFKDGVENTRVTSRLPKTVSALKSLPLYGLSDSPFEVFFSILKPGQHIVPHYGLSNHSLTVHLPLVVPGDGYLKVDQEKRVWREGQVIAFDDSYIHEAINLSEQDRVVLIFSVWHPEISDIDKLAIKASFDARKQWLENRISYL